MYIKEKLVKLLKMKNAVLTVISVFEIAVSVAVLASLISFYWGDFETVITARATPESVIDVAVGIILLIYARWSGNMICDAYFYSGYFEGDLDGKIKYDELAAITGRSISALKRQLHFFRRIYMKGYGFLTVGDVEEIELDSRKCDCECRRCGALIEKKIFFTGECPYCGSSDLFAKILTDNRFYSISHKDTDERKKPSFYTAKRLIPRKALYLSCLCLGLMIMLISLCAIITQITHYNDHDYLVKVLLSGESYSSFELIKAEIADNIIWTSVLMCAMLPLIAAMRKRLKYICAASACAEYFAKHKRPFVKITSLPPLSRVLVKKFL